MRIPRSPHNGLAEVELQAGRFEAAQKAAHKAQELAPQEWVAAYNLGMIEDRLANHAAGCMPSQPRPAVENTRFSTQNVGAFILE